MQASRLIKVRGIAWSPSGSSKPPRRALKCVTHWEPYVDANDKILVAALVGNWAILSLTQECNK
jgi:hypothetical protein